MNRLRRKIEPGEVVIIWKGWFKPEYTGSRAFRCQAGFGLSAVTRGTAVMGTFLEDGEKARIGGMDIDPEETAEYQAKESD